MTYKRYSPRRALLYSILGTVGSMVVSSVGNEEEIVPLAIVGSVGMLVTPSLGHIYTRDWWRALVPMGLRVVGVVSMVTSGTGDVVRSGQLAGGALLFLSATAYSIIAAPRSARRANRKLQQRLGVTPTSMADAAGRNTMGLALTGSF